MKIDILNKKEPFTKSLTDVWWVPSRWKITTGLSTTIKEIQMMVFL